MTQTRTPTRCHCLIKLNACDVIAEAAPNVEPFLEVTQRNSAHEFKASNINKFWARITAISSQLTQSGIQHLSIGLRDTTKVEQAPNSTVLDLIRMSAFRNFTQATRRVPRVLNTHAVPKYQIASYRMSASRLAGKESKLRTLHTHRGIGEYS